MTLSKLLAATAAFATAATLATSAGAATTISSTFDVDADGWRFGTYEGVGGSGQPVDYDAANGRISRVHGFGGWGFIAPQKFLGEKSDFIGGTLSFDLSALLVDAQYTGRRPLVILTGTNGTQIFSDWGPTPGPDLQNFVVSLVAEGFYSGGLSVVNGPVSQADFAAVMGDLRQIEILGDWTANVDTVRLDNVELASGVGAVPEPATWAMMILGFGAAGAVLRHRRAAEVCSAA